MVEIHGIYMENSPAISHVEKEIICLSLKSILFFWLSGCDIRTRLFCILILVEAQVLGHPTRITVINDLQNELSNMKCLKCLQSVVVTLVGHPVRMKFSFFNKAGFNSIILGTETLSSSR